MTPTEILVMLAELLGGLAFFLYGMSMLSSGLEKMAGGKLEHTLQHMTRNDFFGFVLGAGITIAIQSSSAMTVMLVGLVNSGIMGFADTFGMIMGSHVGTTLTAWILTLSGISGDNFLLTLLRPMTFSPLLAFVGIAMTMFSKRERRRNLGVIFVGFAVLMAGMDFMSNSMNTFRNDPAFQSLLTAFTSPLLAFLASTVFTGVIQSSAATVAIVQALALSASQAGHPLTYQIVIPLVLGANVGTCMTALLSSIGTSRDAKRVVAMHIYSNALGGIACVILMYVAMATIPSWLALPCSMIAVATVHSLFNILNTVVFIPLKKPLLRLCELTVRSGRAEQEDIFLDERLFSTPSVAVNECTTLTVNMAAIAHEALLDAISLIRRYDSKKVERVHENEALADRYEDKLSTGLVHISGKALSDSDSRQISKLLHAIGDFERLSDHALNLADAAEEIHEKGISFSHNARVELEALQTAISDILELTMKAFRDNDIESAAQVEPLEQVIDLMGTEIRRRHIERLQNGECTIELGFVLSDLLNNYERISDHCSNLAVAVIEVAHNSFDTHEYLNGIKTADEDFRTAYEACKKHYLPLMDAPTQA